MWTRRVLLAQLSIELDPLSARIDRLPAFAKLAAESPTTSRIYYTRRLRKQLFNSIGGSPPSADQSLVELETAGAR
jgi:hypothetical protein